MTHTYFCGRCGAMHSLGSGLGASHLQHALDRDSFGRALEFTLSAGAYAYIVENTQQYVRDTEVFNVLADKFARSGIFQSQESASTWLQERLAAGPGGLDSVLRRLQGDGAGEVDVLRHLNGSLRGLFYRTEFIRDTAGHVASNTAGIDLQTVNRFTGKVVETIQVKSNWTADPGHLQQVLKEFVGGANYSPDVTLAGPKELIEQAQRMGIPNRLVVVGDADGNRLSGERLRDLIAKKDSAVAGALTFQGVVERAAKGAIVGAVVTAGISAVGNYVAWRQGRISGAEAFKRIGVDASRGAIVGGALGGLSVLFPPGAIGIGIGIVVGSQVRRIVDIAYGRGAYQDILASMGAVEAGLKATAKGVAVVQRSTQFAHAAQHKAAADLNAFSQTAGDLDPLLDRLREFRSGGSQR